MTQEGIVETTSIDEDGDLDSVRTWIEGWGAEVAAVDFAAARHRFDPAVVAFGTFADVVVGIESVEASQWTKVWPKIDGFSFMTEMMKVIFSADRMMAAVAVSWASTGFDEAGESFPRPGRATIVVRRADRDAPWLCIHTHFSLARGVAAQTFGRPSRR